MRRGKALPARPTSHSAVAIGRPLPASPTPLFSDSGLDHVVNRRIRDRLRVKRGRITVLQ